MTSFDTSRSRHRIGPRRVATILLLSLAAAAPSQAQEAPSRFPKPADWSQNDWYNFVESAVQIALGDAYGAAGGVAPIVDVYSAVNAAGNAVKPGLTLWLNRKMVDAATQGDWERHDRYNAFFTCLTKTDACAELRRLERELKAKLERQKPLVATTRRSDDRPNRCDDITGTWSQSSAHVGSSTWKIIRSGSGYYAEESGLGSATGFATLGGKRLAIHWETPNGAYAGKYSWSLDETCTGGTGELVFDRKPANDRQASSQRSTVRRP